MPAPPPEHDHAAHRCPECGGDAASQSDRRSLARPGARLRRLVAFVVLLAAYLGALAYWGKWQHDPLTHRPRPVPRAEPENNINEGRPDAQSLSLDEVRAALDGDDALLDEARAMLREALEPWPIRDKVFEPLSARLELHSLRLRESHRTHHQMLGLLVFISAEQEFEDAAQRVLFERRSPSAAGTDIDWWPVFTISTHSPTHIASVRYVVYYRNIIALLLLIGFLSWTVNAGLRYANVSKRPRRTTAWAVATLLLSSASLGAMFNIDEYQRTDAVPYDRDPLLLGAWFDADTIRGQLDDRESARLLLRAMMGSMDRGQPEPIAVVVGKQYEPIPRQVFLPVKTRSLRASVMIPLFGGLYAYRDSTFVEPRSDAYLKQLRERKDWWKTVAGEGVLEFSREQPRFQSNLRIQILPVALLLSSIWLLWRLVYKGHAILLARRQRKRVNRGQCIFCAYPLSPEALAARWDKKQTRS